MTSWEMGQSSSSGTPSGAPTVLPLIEPPPTEPGAEPPADAAEPVEPLKSGKDGAGAPTSSVGLCDFCPGEAAPKPPPMGDGGCSGTKSPLPPPQLLPAASCVKVSVKNASVKKLSPPSSTARAARSATDASRATPPIPPVGPALLLLPYRTPHEGGGKVFGGMSSPPLGASGHEGTTTDGGRAAGSVPPMPPERPEVG